MGAQVIALGDGKFDARAVQTGVSAQGLTEILQGVRADEEVVASGQFLLDSEVSLREGLAKLSGPTAGGNPDTPLDELVTDSGTLAEIDHLTDMALYFYEALTEGYQIDPTFLAPAIQTGDALGVRFSGTRLAPVLEGAVTALMSTTDATDEVTTRNALAALMTALDPWLMEGAPAHYRDAGLAFYRETETGRAWLQQGSEPTNPYGTAQAEKIAWPDPMNMNMSDMSEVPQ